MPLVPHRLSLKHTYDAELALPPPYNDRWAEEIGCRWDQGNSGIDEPPPDYFTQSLDPLGQLVFQYSRNADWRDVQMIELAGPNDLQPLFLVEYPQETPVTTRADLDQKQYERWEIRLCSAGVEELSLLSIIRKAAAFDFEVQDVHNRFMKSGYRRTGAVLPKHKFDGFHGDHYAWCPVPFKPNQFQLVHYERQKTVVGSYTLSQSGDRIEGRIVLSPDVARDQTVALSAALLIHEYDRVSALRQQRKQQLHTATAIRKRSGGNLRAMMAQSSSITLV
ncbi:uncharacterized protein BJ171DRAFT_471845 [Polychytrium aggregatum]|uniref:uncharacterized protein n=1 Tax=Polychytrium aggregatum TaxID=110093 RepID=UPI0022FE2EDA|nr:uncharacterized protein BJ171DRAFT_471845 [Polychytrium aggregatum]KAI9208151.1 hypothetical protein BJ171DRAFT_471845 [Polychytrium aggregatum]